MIKVLEINQNQVDNNKTPLNLSILFSLLHAVIPGLLVWLLLDPSLDLMQINIGSKISLGMMFVISISTIIFTVIFTFITWKLYWHEKDQFIFSCDLILAIMTVYLTGATDLSVWIRFIICLSTSLVGALLISFILMITDNYAYKKNMS